MNKKLPHPSQVWPHRKTSIPAYAATNITIFSDLAFDLFIVVCLTIVGAATDFLNWAFLGYSCIVVIFKIDSQRMFSAALICLIATASTTMLDKNGFAEIFANMAFFFLLAGLIRVSLHALRK